MIMTPKGVEHLTEAASIAGRLAADADDQLRDRLSALQTTLQALSESPLAKSGLVVPLTAPVNRNAKKLATANGDGFEAALVPLEAAVANLSKRAGGAGNIAIT